MTVAIIDYGLGNVGSVRRAFEELSASPTLVCSPSDLKNATRIVLPGVGSFADGMKLLRTGGWVEAIRYCALQQRKPILGICLGMQLLAKAGTEGGEAEGLGLLSGTIASLRSLGSTLPIPHVGWNNITETGNHSLMNYIPVGTDFYFVHSYVYSDPNHPQVIARAEHGVTFPAAVAQGNVCGVQHHPEKSGGAGIRILKNFLELRAC